MPPLDVDPQLRAAARAICEDFDELLDELIADPVFRCGELPAPPKTAGVYVFSENGVVMHVGRTGSLQRRRQEHTGLNNDRHAATFAFRKAIADAVAAHPELDGMPRATLEMHPLFKPYFEAWKQRVRAMDMRCVEISSAAKRHIFEMMASMALGLPEALWDEH